MNYKVSWCIYDTSVMKRSDRHIMHGAGGCACLQTEEQGHE